ncbi:EVE domain-containing protein [Paenibacillus xanthanilyticus]|uniref:UPF0310 protein ACFOZ8_20860 n=1 Tax=Paenibacillus xanthanilyticus TaxID=1783531 RepID=A0ABV8K7U9_9BACL
MSNVKNQQRRCWVGVVSASHVERAVTGGFVQVCHGKAAPLRRMRAGDGFVYYSPRTDMTNGKPLQAFTAIGQVAGEHVYEYRMSDTFVPFRREVNFISCQEVKIADLLQQLSFTRGNRNWGHQFRFGHFEIGIADFLTIARSMVGDPQDFRSISDTFL